MDLIVWRHADAEDANAPDADMARCLSARGIRQATRMAQWLDRKLPDNARVLVSPARRTEQTAQALGRKYKLRDELVPDSSVEDVLGLLKWHPETGPQGKGPVLLVGHQPYLGQIVSRLLGINDMASSIRKGSVWWLRSRMREGQLQTVLMTVASPDLISHSWDDRS